MHCRVSASLAKIKLTFIPPSFPQMDFYKHKFGPDSLKKIEHKQLEVLTIGK